MLKVFSTSSLHVLFGRSIYHPPLYDFNLISYFWGDILFLFCFYMFFVTTKDKGNLNLQLYHKSRRPYVPNLKTSFLLFVEYFFIHSFLIQFSSHKTAVQMKHMHDNNGKIIIFQYLDVLSFSSLAYWSIPIY